jgi:hypothetical protein
MLADDAGPLDLLDMAEFVGDAPVAGFELHRLLGTVGDHTV